MRPHILNLENLQLLGEEFGDRLQVNVPLDRYTAARVGGPAAALLEVQSVDELARGVTLLWRGGLPFVILGSGSNVLVSDMGLQTVVLVNGARAIRFDVQASPPLVWAESGANFGSLARQAAQKGLAGLEWAVGIPGTIGGAVVGNAGAHGGDIAGNLLLAEILQHGKSQSFEKPLREQWPVERFGFVYRSSVLKSKSIGQGVSQTSFSQVVVLSALLRLERSTPEKVKDKIDQFISYRHRTQPPGASMGSMFKNPPGDYAGRLIEAAGLKGLRIGGAEISSLHANFFINLGGATAADILALIQLARQTVVENFGVMLELEIELLGLEA